MRFLWVGLEDWEKFWAEKRKEARDVKSRGDRRSCGHAEVKILSSPKVLS